MCFISNKSRAIFIHIPKTGGTSMSNLLAAHSQLIDIEIGGSPLGEMIQGAFLRRYGVNKHSSALTLKEKLGDLWGTYFKFCIVRNPFTRMLSAFNYCRGWSSGGDENQRFRDKLLEFDCFDSFVASDVYLDHFGPDKMFQPQSAWILGKDGEPLIDFIGKLESINQWVPDILTKFQIPAEEAKRLEKLNSSQSDPRLGLQTLCETSINKIVELYKQDFELFDYSPNLIAALGDVNLQEVTQD